MANAFDHVPQSCRFEQIHIRAIYKNGIEAIVEKKHVLIVGDAGFMQQYGFSFPMNEEWDGRATICVSLDGEMSAKISAAYSMEPIFEMLVERLAENGIQCVIETFDPMICSSFVSEKRKLGVTPISVVHKQVSDLKRSGKRRSRRAETGLLALASRLKLAEAVVWCRRFVTVWRRSNFLVALFSILGLLLTVTLIALGWTAAVNQYAIIIFQMLPVLGILLITAFGFPGKDYFTLDSLKEELRTEAQSMSTKKQRKANKESE